jgi:hypothetical protein
MLRDGQCHHPDALAHPRQVQVFKLSPGTLVPELVFGGRERLDSDIDCGVKVTGDSHT